MLEGGALRIAQVVQDRPCRANSRRAASQAATIERQQLEMLAQSAIRVVVTENPIVQLCSDVTPVSRFL